MGSLQQKDSCKGSANITRFQIAHPPTSPLALRRHVPLPAASVAEVGNLQPTGIYSASVRSVAPCGAQSVRSLRGKPSEPRFGWKVPGLLLIVMKPEAMSRALSSQRPSHCFVIPLTPVRKPAGRQLLIPQRFASTRSGFRLVQLTADLSHLV